MDEDRPYSRDRIADRKRMIFSLAPAYQLAIKMRALKLGVTTGHVVALAFETVWPDDVDAAQEELNRA